MNIFFAATILLTRQGKLCRTHAWLLPIYTAATLATTQLVTAWQRFHTTGLNLTCTGSPRFAMV
ncbi:hypothetical protein D0Y50_14315 [Salinimonas sediminis]|uniref:Uncharacterized protein n=1 Tax=Salinimonas sediminis TaxID=2303538 RepID=A0A346NPG3_9ALTE|nr:hypothetical protein D0Y50_14315 [Salinimonas sediminis]